MKLKDINELAVHIKNCIRYYVPGGYVCNDVVDFEVDDGIVCLSFPVMIPRSNIQQKYSFTFDPSGTVEEAKRTLNDQVDFFKTYCNETKSKN